MKEIKVGDKHRIYYHFGSSPKGYLVHVVAIVDEDYVVYKYFGKHKQWWHYGIERIDIFNRWERERINE